MAVIPSIGTAFVAFRAIDQWVTDVFKATLCISIALPEKFRERKPSAGVYSMYHPSMVDQMTNKIRQHVYMT
jgi:hypothetical protein